MNDAARLLDRPAQADREGPLGVRRRRLRRRLTTAGVACVVGVMATGAGAGIGIRYAQKTGASLGTAAGLLVLVGGLSLFAYAAVVCWRALRGWRRIALLPAAFLLLELVLPIGQGVAFSVVPPTSVGTRTPAAFDLAFRDVTVRTTDAVTLSGWYIPTRNGAAVVVRHGAGSTRTSALSQAAVVARAGYGVLLVDARGHGRSGGTGNDRGWFGDRDNQAAVTFLAEQPDVDPSRIAVLGLSMGAEEAIGAAGTDRRIRAVVAEGVTSRTATDKAAWLPRTATGLVERGMDWVTDRVIVALSPAPQPGSLRSSVVAARASFLLITAGREPQEARAAAALRDAAPQRVTTWAVTGAEHTRGLAQDEAGWTRRVVSFLNTHLARGLTANAATAVAPTGGAGR